MAYTDVYVLLTLQKVYVLLTVTLAYTGINIAKYRKYRAVIVNEQINK